MRKWIAPAVLLFSVTATATATAAEPYAGIAYTQANYKEDGFSTVSPTALTIKLGTQVNPNVAVEGRLGTGLSDDSINVSGTNIALEVDYYYGLYFKGILPAGAVSPYVMVGFTRGEITASAPGVSVSGDDSSESFGIGLDFALNKTTALNFEFAKLLDGDGYEVDTISVGMAFRF